MRKISRRATFAIGIAIAFITVAVLAMLVTSFKSNEENRHIATREIGTLNDLDHELREVILQDHSFLLNSYDPLVAVTNRIEKVCPRLMTLKDVFLFSSGSQNEAYLKQYCDLSQQTLIDVESFKSRNSLLKNSLKYFPTLVAGFTDQKNRLEALALYSEILRYCLQPADEMIMQMYAHMPPL
jgi:hypothetical protein